jgi:hypothetical protein
VPTSEMSLSSPGGTADRGRDARATAVRLVHDRHHAVTVMRRRRTVVGVVAIGVSALALVATFWQLGVPPQEHVWATVLWGAILVARTAAAAAIVYLLVRAVQWTRGPWRLRAGLTDALTDAGYVGGDGLAERMSQRFGAPARWWSPADLRRAEADLARIVTYLDGEPA